jgi:hypothetical protein
MKLLPIPGCQTIVTEERRGPATVRVPARLCGATSVAVIREDDGQERFVCADHRPDQASSGMPWRLHRREVAAAPVSSAALGRWARQHRAKRGPRGPVSAEARERMAAGQRERWARARTAEKVPA